MVRKQIYLSVEQDRRLRQIARRERRSEAEVMREALDRHLGGEPITGEALERDPLWGIVGMVHGGPDDVSVQVDHYLYGAPKR